MLQEIGMTPHSKESIGGIIIIISFNDTGRPITDICLR
jgi:hypothetical protein